MVKRWRRLVAKPGEIKVGYGKESRHDDPDLLVAWGGGGADKSDARTVLSAIDRRHLARTLPGLDVEEQPSLAEELEQRGYDITTLKFSIQRKAPPEGDQP
ncbi:MAG: hypothetical protein CMN74_12325 [Sphingorhabdus sp.]|nr:hypothetical protein [Sphingorhabdus sp.]|tara:strand:- start:1679 stop:1981 length:303 start_codon:yes stop_codon:yes gene_type:complete